MMVDLKNVTLAFDWIRVYHEDLSKLFVEIKAAFEKRGYACLTGDSIDSFQGKLLAKSYSWAPPYAYQFFQPPGRTDVLLAVLVVANDKVTDVPYVTLARFDGGDIDKRVRDVTYWWGGATAADDADRWYDGEWKGFRVRRRWFLLSNLAGAADVDVLVVDPMVNLGDPAPQTVEA